MATTDRQSGDSSAPDLRLTRRDLWPVVGAAATLAALGPAALTHAEGVGPAPGKKPAATARFVYVGTYTAPNTAPGGTAPSQALGVYVFKLDPRTGALSPVQVVPNIPNPSWVTLDPGLRYLYAVSELSSWNGTSNSGGLTAYAVNQANGNLTLLNNQPTMGAIPAFVSVDPTGRYALVANYNGANYSVLPIQGDGSLGPPSDVHAVTGTGPNADRQEAPHPHQIQFGPAGHFVFGNDLGTDRVWTWTLQSGKLVPNAPPPAPPAPPYAQVAGGSGPRHTAFHPSGKFAYVISEMASSITAFALDEARGTMLWLQTVSSLPPRFTGTSAGGEIVMHPSGQFVYGSNRGHNSIVGFTIDQSTGKLDPIGWASTQGSIPRSFNIDPSGALLLAANQNSNNIVPFAIHPKTGMLKPTHHITQTPTPVCIQFGPQT